jgi:hypothetical protein
MKAMKTVGLGLALLGATAAVGATQDTAVTLSPGATVRLAEAATGPRLQATVVEVAPDFLLVRTEPGAPPRRIELSGLHGLEVSKGKRGNAGKGAVIGFVPGFLAGAVLAYGLSSCTDGGTCGGDAGITLAGGAVVGATTGLIGALIGGAHPTERWQAVPLPGRTQARFQPTLTAVRGGLAAGLTLRF